MNSGGAFTPQTRRLGRGGLGEAAVPGSCQCTLLTVAPTDTCGAWVSGILQGGLLEPLCLSLKINAFIGLPWWLSGKESTCPHRFNPWAGKIPRAAKQLDRCPTATEPGLRAPLRDSLQCKAPTPDRRSTREQKEDPAQPETSKTVV